MSLRNRRVTYRRPRKNGGEAWLNGTCSRSEQLNGDCPKRDAHGLHERCDLLCPDLPKVL